MSDAPILRFDLMLAAQCTRTEACSLLAARGRDQLRFGSYVGTGCHFLTEIVYAFSESHTRTIAFLPGVLILHQAVVWWHLQNYL